VRGFLAAACVAALFASASQAQEGALTLGAGFHYSSGEYGTRETTRIASIAANARYERGAWVYKATLPVIEIDGPSAVVPGFGPVRGGPSPSRRETGLGDLVISATHATYYDRASALGLDLTAKVKLPTADESKGLGTGELDYAFLADVYKTMDRLTGFGGIGFHVLGDSPAFPLENAWSANLGLTYKLDERDSIGAMLEGRERVVSGGSPQRELTGFWMRRLDREWRAQAYALIGLADGSPDWGLGLSLARPL
jgi:hypothetical protein